MTQRWLVNLAVRDYPGASEAFTLALDEQAETIDAWWCSADPCDRAFTDRPQNRC